MPRQKPQRLGQTQAFDGVRRKAEANKRKATYAERTRVKLIRWAPSEIIDEYQTVPAGTLGWTGSVDDIGTVWIEWDNGATIGVTVDDEVEAVPVCDICNGTGNVTNDPEAGDFQPVVCAKCKGTGEPK